MGGFLPIFSLSRRERAGVREHPHTAGQEVVHEAVLLFDKVIQMRRFGLPLAIKCLNSIKNSCLLLWLRPSKKQMVQDLTISHVSTTSIHCCSNLRSNS